MVLLKYEEALEKQIQKYQQKIKSVESQFSEKIRTLENDLQNEKQNKAKIKERLDILETTSNKPKKEVSTETDLNWDEKIKELYEKLKTKNIKEAQLFNKIKELEEENK